MDSRTHKKEKQIQKDLNSNIIPDGGDYTVLDLVEKYIRTKTGVRHNTKANYKFVINVIKKEAFGQKRIDKVKVSDAKEWLIKMQQILLDDGAALFFGYPKTNMVSKTTLKNANILPADYYWLTKDVAPAKL